MGMVFHTSDSFQKFNFIFLNMNKTKLKTTTTIITSHRSYSTRPSSLDQKAFYHVVALSVPVIDSNNTNINNRASGICSVIYLDLEKLIFNETIIQRMGNLNYSKLVLVIVGYDNFIENKHEILPYVGAPISLLIISLKKSEFFSDEAFKLFFLENKEKNYEVFFIFKNIP